MINFINLTLIVLFMMILEFVVLWIFMNMLGYEIPDPKQSSYNEEDNFIINSLVRACNIYNILININNRNIHVNEIKEFRKEVDTIMESINLMVKLRNLR